MVALVLVALALLAARVDAAAPARVTPASAEAADADDDPDGASPDEAPPGVAADTARDLAPMIGPPTALLDPTAIAAAVRGAPSLRVALAAAYRVAGLADDPAPDFARRSRLAALVPWIGARVGEDETWHDVADPTIGHVFVYDVRATWHFDRLVFDPNEVRASAIAVARRRDRRRLGLLVSRTYFAWVRARAAAAHAPIWSLRADEAAAELALLTDGAWAPG